MMVMDDPSTLPSSIPASLADLDGSPARAAPPPCNGHSDPDADAEPEPAAAAAPPPSSPCLFFDLLTWDLRYYIYQLAFSGRVLHVYLLYRRGQQPDPRWRKGHAPIPAWFPNSPSVSPMDPPFADASIAPQWYWWSCVCGPDDLPAASKRRARKDDAAWLGRQMTLRDACPKGFFQVSDARETILGVSGWLRSCRRAYEETVRLLYATNTFKLDQRLEAFYFPHSLPEQQLAWITSLDIRIHDRDESLADATLCQAPNPSSTGPNLSRLRSWTAQKHYRRIIRGIGASFPALRRLHVSFEGSVRRVPVPRPDRTTLMITTIGEVLVDELEDLLLGPLDNLPAQIERQVLFYRSVYTALRNRAGEIGDVHEQDGDLFAGENAIRWRRFWRSPTKEEGAGYWIYEKG